MDRLEGEAVAAVRASASIAVWVMFFHFVG